MERQDLARVAAQYWESAAVNAAVQLGLFARLSHSAAGIETLTQDLSVSPIHLEALLEALLAMGIVCRDDSEWAIAPQLVGALDPESADSLIPVLAFNGDLFGLWGRLADSVREGKPPVPDNPHLGSDADRTRRFVQGMHSRASLYADALAHAVDLTGVQRLLDVGGGPGTFAAALATAFPALRVTVFDLPPVVEVAAGLQSQHPARDRLNFEAGTYHVDALPIAHDGLLYAGALHQETEESARELFSRFSDVLEAGSPCWIVDLMLDPGREGPAFSALFGVNMLLMRPTARMWATDEVELLLSEVGLIPAGTVPIEGTPYHMIKAVKAEG